MLCPYCQSYVPENATFCGECGAPLKEGAVEPPENYEEIKTYWILSLVTLIYCFPAGIVANIYASRASSYLKTQDYYNAREEAAKARNWCIAALWIGLTLLSLLELYESGHFSK